MFICGVGDDYSDAFDDMQAHSSQATLELDDRQPGDFPLYHYGDLLHSCVVRSWVTDELADEYFDDGETSRFSWSKKDRAFSVGE